MSVKYVNHHCNRLNKEITIEESYSEINNKILKPKLRCLRCLNAGQCFDSECEFIGKKEHYIDYTYKQ